MNQREILVLAALKGNKGGCTYKEFNQQVWENCHFKDAILRLREQGHDILMVEETDKRNIRIGRYHYRGRKIVSQKPKVIKENKKSKARDLAFNMMMNKKLDSEVRMLSTQIFNLLR